MSNTKAYVARVLGAPLALLGGWVATQVVSHVNVVGSLGLGKSDIANAVVATGTFLGTAAVTYLSHHKAVDQVIGTVSTDVAGAITTAPTSPEDTLRAQLTAAGMVPSA